MLNYVENIFMVVHLFGNSRTSIDLVVIFLADKNVQSVDKYIANLWPAGPHCIFRGEYSVQKKMFEGIQICFALCLLTYR